VKLIPITDLCDFQGGTQPPKNEWSTKALPGYIRMLQIRDFTQSERTTPEYVKESKKLKKCSSDDILIGRYGASIGKILTGFEGVYNVAIVRTIPDEKRLSKLFLYHILKSPSFQNFIAGIGGRAAQAGFNKDDLSKFHIPNISLNDQIRIAHLLGKVQDLIAQRKQYLQQLNDFLKSVFLEIFGDPIKNEKRWEISTIGNLAIEVKYGTSSSSQEGGQYKYLRMNNITQQGYWNFDSLKYINVSDKDFEKYVIRKGDLVFNRTNSKELVGKTAVYDRDEPVIIAGYLIRVRFDKQTNPWFVWGHLNSKFGKTRLFNLCRNIVGMANINAQELQSIPILKAPIELQNQFASIVEKVEKVKSFYRQSLNDLESLYGALSQQAFKGELDLSKVSPIAQYIAPDTFVNQSQIFSPAVEQLPAINLPETDLLLPALKDRKLIKNLLHKWLQIYCAQLGNATFSLENFMNAAQIRIAELHPDTNFELDLNDYEHIKTWVFDQIGLNALKQTRDIISVNNKRQFGNNINLRVRKSRK